MKGPWNGSHIKILSNLNHRFSRTDISSKKGCKMRKKKIHIDPLNQWLMLTCFLFKIWQMTIIHIYLAPMLNNKSDIWQSWKLCVTFYWILGTHVDPYHALAWTQSKQLHWNHTAEKQEYLDVLSYPIVVLHWLKQMALTCVSNHQSDKAVLPWSLLGTPSYPLSMEWNISDVYLAYLKCSCCGWPLMTFCKETHNSCGNYWNMSAQIEL